MKRLMCRLFGHRRIGVWYPFCARCGVRARVFTNPDPYTPRFEWPKTGDHQ